MKIIGQHFMPRYLPLMTPVEEGGFDESFSPSSLCCVTSENSIPAGGIFKPRSSLSIPAHYLTREYTPDQLVTTIDPLTRKELYDREPEITKYASDMRRLNSTIDRHWPGSTAQVRTVLYPMSGTDASMPFLIFQQADTLILIDEHPFLPPSYLTGEGEKIAVYDRMRGTNFRKTDHVDLDLYLAHRLLANLRRLLPQLRFRSIKVFGPQSQTRDAEVNALIELDFGEGTPLKKILHLNAMTPFRGTQLEWDKAWWWQQLQKLNFDALIVKAAHDSLELSNTSPRLRDFLINNLKQRSGVLLEGFAQDDSGTAKLCDSSYFDSTFEFSSHPDEFDLDAESVVVREVEYGYHKALALRKFHGQK